MRTLPAIALGGIAAAALAGAAIAANHKAHRMDVPLPDGSVAQIEYYGDVAPKVTVTPPRVARIGGRWAPPPGVPAFGGVGRMMEQMNRQMQQIARAPVAPGMNVVSYGNGPAASSVSVTSVSDGSCTRTTQVVSQGDGRPPKVTTSASGNCGAPPAAPRAPASPLPPSEPLDRT